MPLAEGVSGRIVYKFYTDPTITPGIPAISATDPGASGGQILRRVASTLAFTKDTYQSNEILKRLPDRRLPSWCQTRRRQY